MRGVYIHIPFCHQICHYCDFNKVFFKDQPVDEYIETIGKELEIMKQDGISFKQVETIFLGGGTPTSLSENQLDRLLTIINNYIDVSSLKEFSTEANPDELTYGKMRVLKNGGVNRLSIGVQSFDAQLLKAIGRTHGPEDVSRVIEDARKANFDNISIDLIYGLPNQTIEQWSDTLHKATALDLKHYSGYSLIVEPKTVFYNMMNKGKLPLPGEDIETEMFDMLIEHMSAHGRERYEVSNFAVPGFESAHNLLYWDNANYAGVGAGAHGYLSNNRYSNIGPLKRYMEKVEQGERPIQQTHIVTKVEAMEEEMFLGLRKTKGVSYSLFNERFNETLDHAYGDKIRQLIEQDYLERQGDYLKLTSLGLLRGNDVFEQFLK